MEERASDTAETFSSQPLPGDPSDQNTEESDAPTGGDSDAHRRPSDPQTERGREGGAGEDSQATGSPSSAG